MKGSLIIFVASIVICAAAQGGDVRQNKIKNKSNGKDIDEKIYPTVKGDVSSKNKNVQTLSAFLKNVNLYTTAKKSQFKVCRRSFTKQEENLTKKLVKSRQRGLKEYKKNHQRCIQRKRRSKFLLECFYFLSITTRASLHRR